ncbi:MAG TPA: flippase, partial [Anaerolineae bacterium]|nr:flippase [Anaerolineae bacterium]
MVSRRWLALYRNSPRLRRLTQNVGALGLAGSINLGLRFLVFAYAARALGAGSFGVFSSAYILTSLVFRAAEFGLAVITSREVARDHDLASEYLGNGLVLRFIAGALGVALVWGVGRLLRYDAEGMQVVYMLAAYWMLDTLTRLMLAIFQAYERMGYNAIVVGAGSGLVVLFSAIAFVSSKTAVGLAQAFLLAGLVQFFLAASIVHTRFAPLSLRFQTAFSRRLLLEAYPLAITSLLSMVYSRVDVLLLTRLQSKTDVGLYNAAYTLLIGMFIIFDAVLGAVFPLLSQFYHARSPQLRRTFIGTFSLMSLVGLTLAVIGLFLAKPIIVLAYGASYAPAAKVLKLLLWGGFLIFANNTCMVTLNAIDRQQVVTRVVAIAAPLNVLINLALIPHYSFMGAGVATVVTEGFVLVATYWKLRRFFATWQIETRIQGVGVT